MKKISLILAVVTLVFASACKDGKKKDKVESEAGKTEMKTEKAVETSTEEAKKVVVNLKGMDDSGISGTVVFTQADGKVTMKATVKGLAEGSHAIHIHENADCSTMAAAGGHWNPTGEPHGEWGAKKGFHKGDIGNFEVNDQGVGTITLTTDEWCIGCDDATKNILGHSIIVHEGVDDFVSQPSGAAGMRMACGTIEL